MCQFYSPDSVGKVLNITEKFVKEQIAAGKLKSQPDGNVSQEQLDEYVNNIVKPALTANNNYYVVKCTGEKQFEVVAEIPTAVICKVAELSETGDVADGIAKFFA